MMIKRIFFKNLMLYIIFLVKKLKKSQTKNI